MCIVAGDDLFSAGAIGVVIAGGPAGSSRVSSDALGWVPVMLDLSLPALCRGFNEDVVIVWSITVGDSSVVPVTVAVVWEVIASCW